MACRSSELLSKHVERILDALPEGVFISDAAGTSLRVNRMYEQLTGLTQEQIRGKNVRDLVQEGTFDCILNPEIVRTGRPTTHTSSSSKTAKNWCSPAFPFLTARAICAWW